MKKFIVTGGSGFIGSNLVKYLLKKKYSVINVDNLSYSANPYNLKIIQKNRNYTDKQLLFLLSNNYVSIQNDFYNVYKLSESD